MLTDQQLHDAIYGNAQAKALADAGNDAAAAAAIAAALPPVFGPISSASLLIWAASRQVFSAVVTATSSTNAGISSACLAVRSALSGGASSLDLTNPTIAGTGGLLDGLTAAGILPANTATAPAVTPGSKADLLAYASSPATVLPGDVSRVWAQYRPNGQITGQPS